MSKRTILASAVVIFLLLVPSVVHSYKDKTHQVLTKRALKIAAINDQDLPEEFAPTKKYGQAIINGAGQHKKGEDYTKYRVKGSGCKLRVHVHRSWFEPLNHFRFGMNGGTPAILTAERFYEDAVRTRTITNFEF